MMIKEVSTDKYTFGSQEIQKAQIDMKESDKADKTSMDQIKSNFKEKIGYESKSNGADNLYKICNKSLA